MEEFEIISRWRESTSNPRCEVNSEIENHISDQEKRGEPSKKEHAWRSTKAGRRTNHIVGGRQLLGEGGNAAWGKKGAWVGNQPRWLDKLFKR